MTEQAAQEYAEFGVIDRAAFFPFALTDQQVALFTERAGANGELSGLVAKYDEDGNFLEVVDLGPEPVGTKPGRVLPIEPPPSAEHRYDGTVWVLPMVIRTIEDVKAEAARRIEAVMPDYKQRNNLALATELMLTYGLDTTTWPADMRARYAEGMAQWAEIKRLRARSDAIEAMEPIPSDLVSDTLWA